MKITINRNQIDLSVEQLEESKVTFSFLNGRRFHIKDKDQTFVGNLSLNDLIRAVKKEPTQEQNFTEVQAFLKLFNRLRHQGYENSEPSIKKENFLIQLLAKIKHFFAEIRRSKLLKELAQTSEQLKKDHYSQLAFKKWQDRLRRGLNSSEERGIYLLPKYFEKIIKELVPRFSNEIILDLKELFSITNRVVSEESINLTGFRDLINVAKEISASHREEVVKLLKEAIDCRVEGLKVLPGELKFLEVTDCLKALAVIDSESAKKYQELVQFNLGLCERENNWKKDGWLEILSMIDLPNFLSSISSLNFDENKGTTQNLICSMVEAGHRHPEQILSALEKIPCEETKTIGLLCLVDLCSKSGQEIKGIHPFIQKLINNCKDEQLCTFYAIIYAELGETKKALDVIEKISNKGTKEAALIRMAKIYAKKDIAQAAQILEKINVESLEVSSPYEACSLAKIYSLVDVEKALKVCDKITDNGRKIRALISVSNVLKKTNLERANLIWQTILDLANQADYSGERYFSLLDVVLQKAEIDPQEAKQYLENKLQCFPEKFTMKTLFENLLSPEAILNGSAFLRLIKTYAKLDPEATEEWMKQYTPFDEPMFEIHAYLSLR